MNYDYLDRIPQDDTPTAHNTYPQACKRPLWLIEAAETVDIAWRVYDTLVEDEIFSSRPSRYEKVTLAREDAEAAQAKYSKLWHRWNDQVAAQLAVTP